MKKEKRKPTNHAKDQKVEAYRTARSHLIAIDGLKTHRLALSGLFCKASRENGSMLRLLRRTWSQANSITH